MDDMEYTDFANGETRWIMKTLSQKKLIFLMLNADYNGLRANAQKIVLNNILTN